MFGFATAEALDDLAWMGKRLLRQLGIAHQLGGTAREQVCRSTPGLKRRLLAGGGNIGIVKADCSSEDLEFARHRY